MFLLASLLSVLNVPDPGPEPVHVPLVDAGTYHFASGTFTPPGPGIPRTDFAPNAIYCNTEEQEQGMFYLPSPSNLERVDYGRVINFSDFTPMAPTVYDVTGMRIAYCTSQPTGAVDLSLRVYPRVEPCSALVNSPPPVADLRFNGVLPGSALAGQLSCWEVTIDLSGAPEAFQLASNQVNPNNPSVFGYGIQFHDTSAGPSGPLLAGRCELGQSLCTGYGNLADYWTEDALGLCSGCTNPCSGPSGKRGSFFFDLRGAESIGPLGDPFCTATPNFAGPGAVLHAFGSTDVADRTLRFVYGPFPTTSTLLFFGPSRLASEPDWDEGVRCVGGGTRRMYPILAGPQSVRSEFFTDFSASYATSFLPGTTLHFQAWNRGTMSGNVDYDGDGVIEIRGSSAGLSLTFQ